MTYANTINYLYRLQRHGIRPGLDRILSLLTILNHPEKAFPSIHIGGTNGKGSTAEITATVLEKAGYRVGLYTSPHLIDFSERIRIGGKSILEESVVALTERIYGMVDSRTPSLLKQITFFEWTTALAFLYFAESNIDIAVVEVGLGGRFDATNVLKPLVTAITLVDRDHEAYLGDGLLDIANEKAGIIKEGVPLITAAKQPEVYAHLENMAKRKKAPYYRVGKEITLTIGPSYPETQGKISLEISSSDLGEYTLDLPLLGRHQGDNAAIAVGIIALLNRQGFPISKSAVAEGIRSVRLNGRLEIIKHKPRILLDCAHNPHSAQALADFLDETSKTRQGKRWMIFGVMQDKDIKGILKPLIHWPDEIVLTRPKIPRAADPKAIQAQLMALSLENGRQDLRVTIHEKVAHAISAAERRMRPQDRLTVTGSFYTVGEARAALLQTSPSPIRG